MTYKDHEKIRAKSTMNRVKYDSIFDTLRTEENAIPSMMRGNAKGLILNTQAENSNSLLVDNVCSGTENIEFGKRQSDHYKRKYFTYLLATQITNNETNDIIAESKWSVARTKSTINTEDIKMGAYIVRQSGHSMIKQTILDFIERSYGYAASPIFCDEIQQNNRGTRNLE